MPAKKKYKSPKHFIIQRLTKKENHKDKLFWPREMKLLNQLMCKYESEEFWKNFSMDFELNSLAWFKTKDGSEFIERKFREFFLDFEKKNDLILDSDNSEYFQPELFEKRITKTKQIF